MTDQDNEIRTTDMPERFQVCGCLTALVNSLYNIQILLIKNCLDESQLNVISAF